jgi:osmoprotectant transport system substrate-binding protein
MYRTTSHLRRLLGVTLALSLLAAACGGDDDAGESTTDTTGAAPTEQARGSIASEFDLADASVTVGSKEFTEQLILGHMTKLALEATGAEVNDEIGLQGSATVRDALTSGAIDLYWEYLGTGWVTHLGNEEGIPGVQEQYEAVRDADLEQNQIVWLEPTPFNNTYAIAVNDETAEELGVETIADFAELVEENPEGATFCAGGEFATRPDGLPGLEEAYGFELPPENVSTVDDSLVYIQVDQGETCKFGSVFSTDGRIASLGLTVLEDTENFFPPFNAALNVRQDVFQEIPELEDLFEPIAAELDNESMTALNARVAVDGEDPEDVARDFLQENGFIAEE